MQEKTRVDVIYETIRDRICVGSYGSGEVLHEGALGLEFEVSRTPIRQVLQRLAYEKMATVRPGVGTIVARLGDKDVDKYLEIRCRVLAIVADLKVVIAAPDMDRVDALIMRGRRLGDQPGADKIWSMIRDLHVFCNGLIGDDLLQHTDDILFYRTAPPFVEGIRRDPQGAATLLRDDLAEMEQLAGSLDMSAVFTSRARMVRRYGELLLVPAG
ncbi:GntR family transcriptional regulator [Radicibacter daui]|uniref:GntR family transcriptional regulator n=1 Tax=Radicibacter daui TaxID=3064829 RepID=UPI00404694D4